MNELRAKLQRHPAIVGTICVVLLAAAMALGFWLLSGEDSGPQQFQKMTYFYDLNTQELFALPAGTPSPIETDSGPYEGMPAGVRAEVYCCGKYQAGDEYFIGLLEVSTKDLPPDKRPPNVDPNSDAHAYSIRRLDEDQWYTISSPEFDKIQKEARDRCPDGESLQNVYPAPRPIE